MTKIRDLTGQTFGRLIVKHPTNKKSGSSVVWHCECDCGNKCDISSSSLVSGNTKSCGCIADKSRKKGREIAHAAHKKRVADGTDVARILNIKISKNSKSGCTGVCYDNHASSWKAYINFKGKRYGLGYHKALDDAVSARKAAEKEIYGPFLEWYAQTHPEQWKKYKKK